MANKPPSTSNHFFDLFLPTEIWQNIIEVYLEPHQVLRLEHVNRAFYSKLTLQSYWKRLLKKYDWKIVENIQSLSDGKDLGLVSRKHDLKIAFFKLVQNLKSRPLSRDLSYLSSKLLPSPALQPLFKRSLLNYLKLKSLAQRLHAFLSARSLDSIKTSLTLYTDIDSWVQDYVISSDHQSVSTLDPTLLATLLSQYKPLQSSDDMELFSLLFASQQALSPGLFGTHLTYDTVSLSVWFPTRSIIKLLVPYGPSSSFADVQLVIRGLNSKTGIGIVRKTPPAFRHLLGSVCMISTSHLFYLSSSFLEFIESYVADLECGDRLFSDLGDGTKIISSYPTTGPFTSLGPPPTQSIPLQISVSTLPHLDSLQGGSALAYTYQISISYLPTTTTTTSPTYLIYKLTTRSWRIMYDSSQLETVTGPGVIGLFPVLGPALYPTFRGDEVHQVFRYASICAEHAGSRPVWLEGSLSFDVFQPGISGTVPVDRVDVSVARVAFQAPAI